MRVNMSELITTVEKVPDEWLGLPVTHKSLASVCICVRACFCDTRKFQNHKTTATLDLRKLLISQYEYIYG